MVDSDDGTNTLVEYEGDTLDAAQLSTAYFKLRHGRRLGQFQPPGSQHSHRSERTGHQRYPRHHRHQRHHLHDRWNFEDVEIFYNETDPNATQTAQRSVLDYGTTVEMSGEIVPDSSVEDARFEINAEVWNYTLYGQYEECVETSETTEGNENVTTWANLCEVLQDGDDRPKNDYDEILGSKDTFDDIRISRMGVYQGYNSDCTGVANTFMQEGEDGDLNVGCSLIYADVEHRGSDPSKAYGWDMDTTSRWTEPPLQAGRSTSASSVPKHRTRTPHWRQLRLTGRCCLHPRNPSARRVHLLVHLEHGRQAKFRRFHD